jgi:glycyl-tRNA synthetase alpha subunit
MIPVPLAEPLLQWFEDRGCERLQAPDLPVAHGALAPQVFFSLVGGEELRSVHLQPIRRPADARPRLHPHRLTVHHQVYAVLGAGDAAPLEILLGTAGALGVRVEHHDVRLRARSGDLPLAGIQASGWSLWLDGVSIGRVSWITTLGGVSLPQPALEAALGLERLSMVLPEEARTTVRATAPGRMRAWEEADLASEALEVADVERLGARFDQLEAEAAAALASGLGFAAYRWWLEALQVVETIGQRDPAWRRRAELERRLAAGIARCAAHGAGRLSVEMPADGTA